MSDWLRPFPSFKFLLNTEEEMSPYELFAVVLLAALSTGIAFGSIQVPSHFVENSVLVTTYLVAALILYSYSPVVGLAGIVLYAVLIFSRNRGVLDQYIQRTTTEGPRRNEYGDRTISKQAVNVPTPFTTTSSGPREYSQFRETTPSGWMPSFAEGFESGAPFAAFGSEQYADGQFPIGAFGSNASPYLEEVDFRPRMDQGSNQFDRVGPNIDHKLEPLAYTY